MVSQFDKLKFIEYKDYYFLPAFDSKYITNTSFGAKIGVGYGLGRQFRNAELSIINSHLSALKFATSMGLKEVIILEDDVYICQDWTIRIKKLKELLPINWEYIYLSGHSDYTRFDDIDIPTLVKAPKMSGAFSYMVNSISYNNIINFCQSYMTTFDDMLMTMISMKRLDAFVYFPFMTYHTDNISTLWEEESKDHSSKRYFRDKIKKKRV